MIILFSTLWGMVASGFNLQFVLPPQKGTVIKKEDNKKTLVSVRISLVKKNNNRVTIKIHFLAPYPPIIFRHNKVCFNTVFTDANGILLRKDNYFVWPDRDFLEGVADYEKKVIRFPPCSRVIDATIPQNTTCIFLEIDDPWVTNRIFVRPTP